VDIPIWNDEAVHVLSEVFRFHPLAVKDARERNRVPKMHAYHDHVFVILHTPERGRHGHVHYIELDQFVGVRYLVTVHGPINPAVHPDVALRETRAVLERIQAGRLQPVTPSQLSHAIVTVLTRGQEDFIETLTKDVWQLEQRLTGGNVGDPEKYLDELFRARHGLLAVRTMGAQNGARRSPTLVRRQPQAGWHPDRTAANCCSQSASCLLAAACVAGAGQKMTQLDHGLNVGVFVCGDVEEPGLGPDGDLDFAVVVALDGADRLQQ